MSFRILAAFAVCALACFAGCASPGHYDGTGRCPPDFKFENGHRLVKEVGWFYADFQDVVFGVDYNQDMEDCYGRGPYDSIRRVDGN